MLIATGSPTTYKLAVRTKDHYSDDPYIPFLSITPIGKGSPLETVIRPRGPKGNAGF